MFEYWSFQSPLHRGSLWNLDIEFSHLIKVSIFQSPLHRGSLWNEGEILHAYQDSLFQSPLHRGSLWNSKCAMSARCL